MDVLVLVVVFAMALAVSCLLVGAFAPPIDGVIARLVTGDMAAAWSKYAKFALFAACLTGGLRLTEIQAYVSPAGAAPHPPIDSALCLLEAYRTLAGALGAASWVLLVFFGCTLAAYAALEGYYALKPALGGRGKPEEEHRPVFTGGRH